MKLDNELIILKIFNMVLSRENCVVDTFLWVKKGLQIQQICYRVIWSTKKAEKQVFEISRKYIDYERDILMIF